MPFVTRHSLPQAWLASVREKFLGAMARGPAGVKLAAITDGLSNTVIVAEGAGRPGIFVSGKKVMNPRTGNIAFGTPFTADGWGWADINGASVSTVPMRSAFKMIRPVTAIQRSHLAALAS